MCWLSVSVIIPAKNEERNLPRLLGPLSAVPDLEVLIADGASQDRTKEVAERFGAIVVPQVGDPMTIGQGRNQAAALANGDLFIFLDADTEFDNALPFFEYLQQLFQDPKIVAAVPRLEVFAREATWFDRLFHRLYNLVIQASFHLGPPVSGGQCQVVRADIFRAVGGYPEHMAHAEDSALLQKLAKWGKLQFLPNWVVYHSPRRFRVWGYGKTCLVAAKSLLAKAIFGKEVLHEWERVGE